MRNVVLHCPALGRDLGTLRAALPDLAVYEGERTSPGANGCLLGHKGIVREAMARGDDRVFVVEDDCKFTEHFDYAEWCNAADQAQVEGFDVLSGGSTRTYDPRAVRAWRRVPTFDDWGWERYETGLLTVLVEVSAFHSAHCVVYFRSGYEKALDAVVPLDWSLGRDCGMRCAVVHPFVAVQSPSRSGIEECAVDYGPLYAEHERVLARQLGLQGIRTIQP